MGFQKKYFWAFLAVSTAALAPDAALAYIGPGSGLSAIGSVFAVIAAVFFALVGFIWYPIKRVLRLARGQKRGRPDQ